MPSHENPDGPRTSDNQTDAIREVIGVFTDDTQVRDSLRDLDAAGFDAGSIGLLAASHAIQEKFADVYVPADEDPAESGDPDAPRTAFIQQESTGNTANAMFGSLFFVGATTTAGVLVMSAAVLASPILAGLGGVAVMGGIAATMRSILKKSEAERLQEQIDQGHLVLVVRTPDPAREAQAQEILSKYSAIDVRTYEVPAGE